VIAVGAIVAAAVDFGVTSAKVDPLPADCAPATDIACQDARNRRLSERGNEKQSLEDGYGTRAWLYALLVVAAGGVALTRFLPQPDRRFFTSLGVAGVALGVVTALGLLLADRFTLAVPALPAFLPSLGLLIAAALGSLMRPAPEPEGAGRMRQVALAGGLGLTALTVVLAIVAAAPDSECGSGAGAPDWAETIYGAIFLPVLAAFAFGLLALVVRRWVVALVCFTVNPVVVLFLAADMCAFY
jgi:hypothetical protein